MRCAHAVLRVHCLFAEPDHLRDVLHFGGVCDLWIRLSCAAAVSVWPECG